MSQKRDQITERHRERGEVKCECCGNWTAHSRVTLDDCDLCPKCWDALPPATSAEVAEYTGEALPLGLVRLDP